MNFISKAINPVSVSANPNAESGVSGSCRIGTEVATVMTGSR